MPQTKPRSSGYMDAMAEARRLGMLANTRYPDRISSHTRKHRVNQARKRTQMAETGSIPESVG